MACIPEQIVVEFTDWKQGVLYPNPADVEMRPDCSVIIGSSHPQHLHFVRKWQSWAWLTHEVEQEEAIQPDIEYAIRIRYGANWLDCVVVFNRAWMHGELRERLEGCVCGHSRMGQVSTRQARS